MKKVQLLTFLVGDRLGMVRVVEREDVTRACSGRPFFHGMAAFALEENDRIQEARVHAFKALEIEPNDVWAVHVMAHIFFAEAQLKEGIEWSQSMLQHDKHSRPPTIGMCIVLIDAFRVLSPLSPSPLPFFS